MIWAVALVALVALVHPAPLVLLAYRVPLAAGALQEHRGPLVLWAPLAFLVSWQP